MHLESRRVPGMTRAWKPGHGSDVNWSYVTPRSALTS